MERCHVEECCGICCRHGVLVDLAEASRIVEYAERIYMNLSPEQRDYRSWFESTIEEDDDFPSGLRIATSVIDDSNHPAGSRCVFLGNDNLCALQVTSLSCGEHPWHLKPFYCALYPLVLVGDTLCLDDGNPVYTLGGTCQRPVKIATTLYTLFEEEMKLALGQSGYSDFCNQVMVLSGAR